MQEVFEEIKKRIMITATEACGYAPITRVISETEIKEIIESASEEYNNGWIPYSERLPPQPKKTNLFEIKCLKPYLVSVPHCDYPYKALWNGKYFTDGFIKFEANAWQPLPDPYQPNGE